MNRDLLHGTHMLQREAEIPDDRMQRAGARVGPAVGGEHSGSDDPALQSRALAVLQLGYVPLFALSGGYADARRSGCSVRRRAARLWYDVPIRHPLGTAGDAFGLGRGEWVQLRDGCRSDRVARYGRRW